MQFIENKQALAKLQSEPVGMADKLLVLRQLIIDVAIEENINSLEETLKWNQVSYITKQGSTIRLGVYDDQHYALYVHCQSLLIPTYKELYADQFIYQGKRALLFTLQQKLPKKALKHCIALALRYHQLKHLPLLGA